jgi:ankyrin repeat protein
MMDLILKQNPESINGLDYNGNTPLHDAAKTFNYPAINRLFELKNDLGRIRNFKGCKKLIFIFLLFKF